MAPAAEVANGALPRPDNGPYRFRIAKNRVLPASALGEPELIMPMQRGGQPVPSGQRLHAVAVLAETRLPQGNVSH